MDNSIQATLRNSPRDGRKIRTLFQMGNTEGSSFLIVWDNGQGMDSEGIRTMATYFKGELNTHSVCT